jgi:hypothetical protein
MRRPDAATLAALLVAIPAGELRDWATEQLEPAHVRRRRRLEARDVAIRTAAALFPDKSRRAQAQAISRYIDRFLRGWSTPDSEAFEAIARLNGNCSLAPRSIARALNFHTESTPKTFEEMAHDS